MNANRRHYEHLLFLAARRVQGSFPRANLIALQRGYETRRWYVRGVPIPTEQIVTMIVEVENIIWQDEEHQRRQRRRQAEIDRQEALGEAYN